MKLDDDNKAWNCLTEEEQLALALKHGHTKSTWQTGEIMEKSHYKLLEILARAEKFLKLFTEQITLYDEIIPDWLEIDDRIKTYFKLAILKRYKPNKIVKEMNDEAYIVTSVREKAIIKAMKSLVDSKSVADNNVAEFIFQFDRWNNFRILPREIQYPSAFKRRNKNHHKRIIKNMLSFNQFSIEKLIENYYYFNKHPKTKMYYIPLVYDFLEIPYVLTTRRIDDVVENFSKLGFYIFNNKDKALDFYELIYEYKNSESHNCKFGLKFWPRFRVQILESINYNRVQKIIPYQKHLATAFKDIDRKLASKTQ